MVTDLIYPKNALFIKKVSLDINEAQKTKRHQPLSGYIEVQEMQNKGMTGIW